MIPLGIKDNEIFLYSSKRGIVSTSLLIPQEVLDTLASIEYWNKRLKRDKFQRQAWAPIKRKFREQASSHEFNYFDYCLRGIYEEDGRLILNTGKFILGKPSKKIYLLNSSVNKKYLPLPEHELDKAELAKLTHSLSFLNFSNKYDHVILMSWCLIAPFFRALSFRPHLNVQGHSSAGKGWLRTNLIERFLKPFFPVSHYGNTSTHPAFLKKMAKLPPSIVLLDEKEGKKRKGTYRDEWLETFRLSGTDEEPYVEKCSSSGDTIKEYPLKFIVALFSVTPFIKSIEDINRFITISMFKKVMPEQRIHLNVVQRADIEKISLGCFSYLFNRWDQFSAKREEAYNLFLSYNLTGHFANKWAIFLALSDMFFFNAEEKKEFFSYILQINESEENPTLAHESILEKILNYPYPAGKSLIWLLKNYDSKISSDLKLLSSQGIRIEYPFLLMAKKSYFVNDVVFKKDETDRDQWFSILSTVHQVKRLRFASEIRSLTVKVPLESFLNTEELKKLNVLDPKPIIEKRKKGEEVFI